MILGVGAIAALALMFVKPDITDHLKALSPFTAATTYEQTASASELANLMDTPSKPFTQTASVQANSHSAAILAGLDVKKANATQEQELVAKWNSKRYRVAGDATYMLVSAAYTTADELKLDPLLILAVAAIESGFNPYAESAMGAQGLMQVMSKLHHEKFRHLGGVKAALNPVANIKVGALILKDYVNRGGSVEAGLKMYVGAAAFATDSGYGSRVLNEYRRLKEVAAGQTAPAVSTTASKEPLKSVSPNNVIEEKTTTVDEDKSASLEPQQRPAAKTEFTLAS
jgi:soluble lytic murein transglycosylase-like protein